MGKLDSEVCAKSSKWTGAIRLEFGDVSNRHPNGSALATVNARQLAKVRLSQFVPLISPPPKKELP
jgi:hypothetical protein